MRPFSYARAASESDAVAGVDGGKFLAGGTTLLDLMKLGVETPGHLVDINRLPLSSVDEADGGLRLGALARNTEVAEHPQVRARYRALSEALLAGASPQLRNMASVGGNLLQRTRCSYFRDVDGGASCNKREPGSGCAAIGGINRMHAVLGTSSACIATHPSDMCVALAALDATIVVRGPAGERKIAFGDFHLLPGEHPDREHALAPGELVTAVTLPATPYFARSRYVKVRDRASYAFALTSAAVALDLEGGIIKEARVALGGVGTKPWRATAAETALVGQAPGAAAYQASAEAALAGAIARTHNAFKIELARRTLVRALTLAAATT
jgi:xanthine dehydrogenase YagS FAD-binding subunit